MSPTSTCHQHQCSPMKLIKIVFRGIKLSTEFNNRSIHANTKENSFLAWTGYRLRKDLKKLNRRGLLCLLTSWSVPSSGKTCIGVMYDLKTPAREFRIQIEPRLTRSWKIV